MKTVNSNYTDWEGEGIHWFLVAGLSVLCRMYCHPVALDHSFLIPGILYEKKKKTEKLSLHMSSPEGKKQGGVPPIYYHQFAFHTPMYIP